MQISHNGWQRDPGNSEVITIEDNDQCTPRQHQCMESAETRIVRNFLQINRTPDKFSAHHCLLLYIA
ncbi:hypothetical protein D9M69_601740 [compost metagenome]